MKVEYPSLTYFGNPAEVYMLSYSPNLQHLGYLIGKGRRKPYDIVFYRLESFTGPKTQIN